MLHRNSLAPGRSSRYGPTMADARPSSADALLRLWLAAGIGMAVLYGWQYRIISDWPAGMAAPAPPRAVPVIKAMYLCLFAPAAVVVAVRWHASRDRVLAGLALSYAALSAASVAVWAGADSLGTVRTLYLADAILSLAGSSVAFKALKLPPFKA